MRYSIKQTVTFLTLSTCLGLVACDRSSQQPNFEQTLTEARSYLSTGQIESTIIESRNLLRTKPEEPRVHNLLGDAYFAVGDFKNAAEHFQTSLQQVNDLGIRLKAADANTRFGHQQRARTLVAPITNELAKSAVPELQAKLLRIRGDLAVANADLQQAQQYYEQALAIDAKHGNSLLGMAKVTFYQEKSQDTADWLNQALASKSDFVEALLFQGNVHLHNKEPNRAEEAFSNALAAVGKFDLMTAQKYRAIEGLAKSYVDQGRTDEALRLNKTLADSPQGKMQQAIRNALTAYKQGDTATAQDNFEEVLQFAPDHQLSNLGLGMIKLQEGDIETAEHLLSQASQDLEGINEKTFVALTLARFQLGKIDEGNAILTKALDQFPQSETLRLIQAGRFANEGNNKAALEILDDLITNFQNIDAVHLKAQIQLQSGDKRQAQRLFRQVIQVKPEFFPAYSGLFDSYDKKPGVVRDEIQKLLDAQSPQLATTQLALGVAHLLNKDFTKAEQAAKGVLSSAPNNAMAKNLLGSALFEQAIQDASNDRLQTAYIKTKEAVKLSPKGRHVTMLTKLAVELQRPDEAVATLQSLVKSKPNFALGHELLSDLMLASNDHTSAMEHAEDAWQIQPTYRRGLKLFQLTLQKQTNKDPKQAAQHLIDWRNQVEAEYQSEPSKKKRAFESSLFALTSVYEQHGFESEAIDIYEQLIQLQPNSALYLNNSAWLKFTQNQPGALAQAKKAYELAPETGEIIDTYAWILVQSGQTEKGLELLKQASQKSPNNRLIREHLQQATEMQSNSI